MEIANNTMSCVYDFSDYQKMYDLTERDLSKSILDFSAGVSNFKSVTAQKSVHVISADITQLPRLPYTAHQFDLVLCTDFIFYHSLSSEKIAAVVTELCRVAEEVRIFPLLDHQGKMSKELGPLMLMLQQKNYGVEVREVPYRLLDNGNAMLRIWEQECHL